MDTTYKNLFAWVAKQNTLKPHIRELIALIAEGAENGERVRSLSASVVEAAQIVSNLTRKNEALEAEVERLRSLSDRF